LAVLSVTLGVGGLLAAEGMSRLLRRRLGRS